MLAHLKKIEIIKVAVGCQQCSPLLAMTKYQIEMREKKNIKKLQWSAGPHLHSAAGSGRHRGWSCSTLASTHWGTTSLSQGGRGSIDPVMQGRN